MTKEDKERKKLIEEARDLDMELSFIEDRLRGIVERIQELNPTKKELKEIEDLIDCYGLII